jgi:hypothetical protein
MKNSLFFSFEMIICQIVLIFLTANSPPIPPEYDTPDNIVIISTLKDTVRHELHIVEYTKNVGYYTSGEAVSKVLGYDEAITGASVKYEVPKAMIQAILFKELRMIDFRDSISDFVVEKCFRINANLSARRDKNAFCRLIGAITSTKGSSTGIGQIFPETAIKAHNWHCRKNGGEKEDRIDCKDISQREKVWRALQDENTSIYFVALILKYEAEANLGIDVNTASDEDIRRLFVRYNGAAYYGGEVFKYYSLFKQIKAG